MRIEGVAMLNRSKISGVHGGAADAACPEAIPAATQFNQHLATQLRATQLLGGLLLLIGP